MKSNIVSRRSFLNRTVCAALAICFSSCTKPVTRYRPDGTPYTEDVDDPVATLAGVVLFCIILGAFAASQNKDKDKNHYNMNDEKYRQKPRINERKFMLTSMVTKNNMTMCGTVDRIFVSDSKGRLLIKADASANILNKDLEVAESLLASAKISNLKKTVVIRLQQYSLGHYRVTQIGSLNRVSDGQYTESDQEINGKIYKIRTCNCPDNVVGIEIMPQANNRKTA